MEMWLQMTPQRHTMLLALKVETVGHELRNCGQPLKAGKGKEMASALLTPGLDSPVRQLTYRWWVHVVLNHQSVVICYSWKEKTKAKTLLTSTSSSLTTPHRAFQQVCLDVLHTCKSFTQVYQSLLQLRMPLVMVKWHSVLTWQEVV